LKLFKKALSVLLTFAMVLGFVVVGVNAEPVVQDYQSTVTRGVNGYVIDRDTGVPAPLADQTLKVGDILEMRSTVKSPDYYIHNISAAVYYDKTVYAPATVSPSGGGVTATSYAGNRYLGDVGNTKYKGTSSSDGTFKLLDSGLQDVFEWQIANPASATDMIASAGQKDASDQYVYGPGSWYKYYPKSWFGPLDEDVDYADVYYSAGDLADPLEAWANYGVVTAFGEFPWTDGGDSKSIKPAQETEFISFYFVVTAVPEGDGGKIGLFSDAVPGVAIEGTEVVTDHESSPVAISLMDGETENDSDFITGEYSPSATTVSSESLYAPTIEEEVITYPQVTFVLPEESTSINLENDSNDVSEQVPDLDPYNVTDVVQYAWFTEADYNSKGPDGDKTLLLTDAVELAVFESLPATDATYVAVPFVTYVRRIYYSGEPKSTPPFKDTGLVGSVASWPPPGLDSITSHEDKDYYRDPADSDSITLILPPADATEPQELAAHYELTHYTYIYDTNVTGVLAPSSRLTTARFGDTVPVVNDSPSLLEGYYIDGKKPWIVKDVDGEISLAGTTAGDAVNKEYATGTGTPDDPKTITLIPNVKVGLSVKVDITFDIYAVDDASGTGSKAAEQSLPSISVPVPPGETSVDATETIENAIEEFLTDSGYTYDRIGGEDYNYVLSEDAEFTYKLKYKPHPVKIEVESRGSIVKLDVVAYVGANLNDLIEEALDKAIADGDIEVPEGYEYDFDLSGIDLDADGLVPATHNPSESLAVIVELVAVQTTYALRIYTYTIGKDYELTSSTAPSAAAHENVTIPLATSASQIVDYVVIDGATSAEDYKTATELQYEVPVSGGEVDIYYCPPYDLYQFHTVTPAFDAELPENVSDYGVASEVVRRYKGSALVKPADPADLNTAVFFGGAWLEDDLTTSFAFPTASSGIVGDYNVINVYAKYTTTKGADYTPIYEAQRWLMANLTTHQWYAAFTEEFIDTITRLASSEGLTDDKKATWPAGFVQGGSFGWVSKRDNGEAWGPGGDDKYLTIYEDQLESAAERAFLRLNPALGVYNGYTAEEQGIVNRLALDLVSLLWVKKSAYYYTNGLLGAASPTNTIYPDGWYYSNSYDVAENNPSSANVVDKVKLSDSDVTTYLSNYLDDAKLAALNSDWVKTVESKLQGWKDNFSSRGSSDTGAFMENYFFLPQKPSGLDTGNGEIGFGYDETNLQLKTYAYFPFFRYEQALTGQYKLNVRPNADDSGVIVRLSVRADYNYSDYIAWLSLNRSKLKLIPFSAKVTGQNAPTVIVNNAFGYDLNDDPMIPEEKLNQMPALATYEYDYGMPVFPGEGLVEKDTYVRNSGTIAVPAGWEVENWEKSTKLWSGVTALPSGGLRLYGQLQLPQGPEINYQVPESTASLYDNNIRANYAFTAMSTGFTTQSTLGEFVFEAAESLDGDDGWYDTQEIQFEFVNGATLETLEATDIFLDPVFSRGTIYDKYTLNDSLSRILIDDADGQTNTHARDMNYAKLELFNQYEWLKGTISFYDANGEEIDDAAIENVYFGDDITGITLPDSATYNDGVNGEWKVKTEVPANHGYEAVAAGAGLQGTMPGADLAYVWAPYYTLSFMDGVPEDDTYFTYTDGSGSAVEYSLTIPAGADLSAYAFPTVEREGVWMVKIGNTAATVVETGATLGGLFATGMPEQNVVFYFVEVVPATVRFYNNQADPNAYVQKSLQPDTYANYANEFTKLVAGVTTSPNKGYVPDGWTPETGTPAVNAGAVTVAEGDVYVYTAVFKRGNFKVEFYNGSKLVGESATPVEYEAALGNIFPTATDLTSPDPTWPFWNLTWEDENGTAYTATSKMDEEGLKLYAHWEELASPVTVKFFDLNGTSQIGETQNLNTGVAITGAPFDDVAFAAYTATKGFIPRFVKVSGPDDAPVGTWYTSGTPFPQSTVAGAYVYRFSPGYINYTITYKDAMGNTLATISTATVATETDGVITAKKIVDNLSIPNLASAQYAPGYTFGSWSVSGGYTATGLTSEGLSAIVQPAGNVVITIVPKAIRYNVWFYQPNRTTIINLPEGTFVEKPNPIIPVSEEEVECDTGYEFDGWAYYEDSTPVDFANWVVPTSGIDINIKATQKPKTNDVYFNDAKGNRLSTYTMTDVPYGTLLSTLGKSLPSTTTASYFTSGYEFDKWQVSTDGSTWNDIANPLTYTMPDGDVTFQMVQKLKTYTFEFYNPTTPGNGAKIAITASNATVADPTVSLTAAKGAVALTAGYELKGWVIKGTSIAFTGDEWTPANANASNVIQIQAVQSKIIYDVKFYDAEKKEVTSAATTVQVGDAITAPGMTDFTFGIGQIWNNKWLYKGTTTEANLAAGQWIIPTAPNKVIELQAGSKYEEYTITFVTEDGTKFDEITGATYEGSYNVSADLDSNEELIARGYLNAGYEASWVTVKGGEENPITLPVTSPTSDLVIKLIPKAIPYTVTFYDTDEAGSAVIKSFDNYYVGDTIPKTVTDVVPKDEVSKGDGDVVAWVISAPSDLASEVKYKLDGSDELKMPAKNIAFKAVLTHYVQVVANDSDGKKLEDYPNEFPGGVIILPDPTPPRAGQIAKWKDKNDEYIEKDESGKYTYTIPDDADALITIVVGYELDEIPIPVDADGETGTDDVTIELKLGDNLRDAISAYATALEASLPTNKDVTDWFFHYTNKDGEEKRVVINDTTTLIEAWFVPIYAGDGVTIIDYTFTGRIVPEFLIKGHKIELDPDGGELVDPEIKTDLIGTPEPGQETSIGKTIIAFFGGSMPEVKKAGYTFLYWEFDGLLDGGKEDSGISKDSSISTMSLETPQADDDVITEEMVRLGFTLKAVYSKNGEITFDTGIESENIDPIALEQAHVDEKLSAVIIESLGKLPTYDREDGSTFTGWYINGTETSVDGYTITEDDIEKGILVVAKYKTYGFVTFNTDGGIPQPANVALAETDIGRPLLEVVGGTLPVVAKDGYTFKEWTVGEASAATYIVTSADVTNGIVVTATYTQAAGGGSSFPIILPIILPLPVFIPIILPICIPSSVVDCIIDAIKDCTTADTDADTPDSNGDVTDDDIADDGSTDGDIGDYDAVDTGDRAGGIAIVAAIMLSFAAGTAMIFGRKKKEEQE
jgi:hypothetical protein